MDLATVCLLLSQDDRSLKDHTREFLDLGYQTNYPNDCLCTFDYVRLYIASKAKLSGDGPRGNFYGM